MRTSSTHFAVLNVFGGVFGNGQCLFVCFSLIIILHYKPQYVFEFFNTFQCAFILVSSAAIF